MSRDVREEIFESEGLGPTSTSASSREEEAERAAFASYRGQLMRSEHVDSTR